MKLMQTILQGFVLIIFLSLSQFAQAQSSGSFSFGCASQARSRSLVSRAIERRVLASIDTGRFSKVRVSVNMIPLGPRNPPLQEYAPEQLSEGLEIEGQNAPVGLAFSVSGATTIPLQCEYLYTARVTTRGLENSTNVIRTATTDSNITIVEQMFGRTIFHAPAPTPTP